MTSDFANDKADFLFPSLIFFLAFLLYLPSVKVSFINDEIAFISRNKAETFTEYISLLDKKDYDGDYYRPLPNLVSGIVSATAGYNEIPYRIFNLLLNAFSGVLVFVFISFLPYDLNNKRLYALFGALFFISFPLNDYAVIWHTDLFDRLVLFFYLLSIIFFLKKKAPGIISLSCFLLAALSKEMAFSLPAVIFIFSFYISKDLKESLINSLSYIFIFILVFSFRWIVFNNNIFQLQDAHSIIGPEEAIKNTVIFLGMLVFPFGLRELQQLFAEYPVFFYLSGFILTLSLLLILIKYRRRDFFLIILFLILLVVIAPASRLLMRWYLYLPSAIFCTLIAYFIFSSRSAIKWKVYISLLIFICYYFITLNRITNWIDVSKKGEISVFELINKYGSQIQSADELVFLTVPGKVDDIPLFQLAFDKHLNHYLNNDKIIKVLSKSYLDNFNDTISCLYDSNEMTISLYGDNYFILSDVEKSVKFNNIDFQGNKLKKLHFRREKEPNKIFFTFSEGKFHFIKDSNEK